MASVATCSIESQYDEVKDLIYYLSRSYACKLSKDVDECISTAHMSFLRAAPTHDPTKGKLGKRIAHRVATDLVDSVKRVKEKRRRKFEVLVDNSFF